MKHLKNGTRVVVSSCSGIDSGKSATVSYGLPIEDSYTRYLITNRKWIPIKCDDGSITAMPHNRLII
jgi:hypothetical protein